MRFARLYLMLVALFVPTLALAAPPTVGVVYFDYEGKDEQLALLKKGLASMLISDLSGEESFSVVERERLEDVLRELKLQSSTNIDKASAVKAGKLLGARYLVLGGYFDAMNTLRIDARVIDVQTGKVMKSVGANGKADEFLTLEQKLATELRAYLKAMPPVKAGKLAKAATDGGVVKPKARAPKQLRATTAAEYGRALSQLDRGDVVNATTTMKKVVKEAPDFELATLDLNRMLKM